MSNRYVQLHRRFAPFTDEVITEDVILRSYSESLLFSRTTLSWDDILKNRLTVVLAEQGSGKTEEFRRRSDDLRKRGDYAFFVPLERLVKNDLRSAISESDELLLDEWFRSSRDAVFFLDSVDESKLIKPSDFEVALRQFAKGVTSIGLRRAIIVLSSRISKWSPVTDSERVCQFLETSAPRPNDGEASPKGSAKIHVVRLLPLDQTMVHQLLEGSGFSNEIAHIKTVFDDCFLWRFVRRPVDALRYAQSMKDGIDVTSLTKLLEHDVSERLRDSPEREQVEPLTPSKALEGARTLAAAVVLTRRRAIHVQDQAIGATLNAVDPLKCLPSGWTPSSIHSLLSRSLFDGASLGTIRFHDPRVRDFLAAQWLQERVKLGCTIETIKGLLLAEFPDGLVVREEMQSMLAWIACGESHMSEEARTWILKASPELFFSEGDPGLLPIEYRKHLLKAYIDRFAGQDYTWTEIDAESLARFAEDALELDLTQIATNATLGADVRTLALRVIRHGRVRGCLEAALQVAINENERTGIRTSAIAVIRDVPETQYQDLLAQHYRAAKNIPEKLLGILIETVFPAVVSAEDVALFVRNSHSELDAEVRTDRSYWLISHFEDRLCPRDALDLLHALLPLAEEAPVLTLNEKPTRISVGFQWLGPWFPALLSKAVQERELNQADVEIVARTWAWLEELGVCTNRRVTLPDEFINKTKPHSQLRREYFWLKYKDHLDRREGEIHWASQFLGYYEEGGFEPSIADLGWLLIDVDTQRDFAKKKIALDTWFDIWQSNGGSRSALEDLRAFVANDVQLSEQLNDRLRRVRFSRLKRFWFGSIRQRLFNRFWWRRIWRKHWWQVKRWRQSTKYSLWLHRHLPDLRSGQRVDVLAKLASEARNGDSMHVSPTTWDGLRETRGHRIADAVKLGCHQVWLEYTPRLPHEREPTNSFTHGDRAGLSGLSMGIGEGDIDIETLSTADVEKAIRYATSEMNGLPP